MSRVGESSSVGCVSVTCTRLSQRGGLAMPVSSGTWLMSSHRRGVRMHLRSVQVWVRGRVLMAITYILL